MNISVFGKLTFDDKKIIKHFVGFVLGRFVKPVLLERTKITINLVEPSSLAGQDKKDLMEYGAWMERHSDYKYTITINSKLFKSKAKTFNGRLKDVLLCVGHELVHVKQYLNDEMVDWWNGQVKYKGLFYKDWEYGEGYWTAPFELEAYSWELALYEIFIEKSSKGRKIVSEAI